MGPIYNRARRVLIHLAGDDGGHAHRAATFVSEKLAVIRQMPGDGVATAPYPSAEEIQLVMEDPKLQSVNITDEDMAGPLAENEVDIQVKAAGLK
jgi:hypothetical protein